MHGSIPIFVLYLQFACGSKQNADNLRKWSGGSRVSKAAFLAYIYFYYYGKQGESVLKSVAAGALIYSLFSLSNYFSLHISLLEHITSPLNGHFERPLAKQCGRQRLH